MSSELIERLTSRKFWAYLVTVIAAFCYAFGLIDEKGMAAITAAAATYQISESIVDYGAAKERAAVLNHNAAQLQARYPQALATGIERHNAEHNPAAEVNVNVAGNQQPLTPST